jgi:hypothetical protein
LLLAVLLWLVGAVDGVAAGPALAQPHRRLDHPDAAGAASDDGVYLSAAVQFELPSLVEDVLDKGIAIYFVAEAELYQERWYWTDRKVGRSRATCGWPTSRSRAAGGSTCRRCPSPAPPAWASR